MDWSDSPQQRAFREEVRAFIHDRFPAHYIPNTRGHQSLEPEDVFGYNWVADRRSRDPDRRRGAMDWAAALAERGWVAPHWPKDYGGAGLSVAEEHILSEEMARARVPQVNGIGVNLLGPTLIAHGSEEQRRRHLPKILSGEAAWAQGFSEPGAGSDLAALQTRAVREGNEYVVNGQKIWTTHAQYADWLFILARTDPDAPKHRGISMLLVEADGPGISINPIVDMRGDVPFNEIYLDGVRIPVANRVGEENRGWYAAMSTLDFERSGIGATVKYRLALEDLVAWVREQERTERVEGSKRPPPALMGHADSRAAGPRYEPPVSPSEAEPAASNGLLRHHARDVLRHEIAQRFIEISILEALALRTVSMQEAGQVPNVEASMNQLFSAELHQRIAATGLKAIGAWGGIWEHEGSPMDGFLSHKYLEAVPYTVLSGTAEIQRNVIATRGLGLPRE